MLQNDGTEGSKKAAGKPMRSEDARVTEDGRTWMGQDNEGGLIARGMEIDPISIFHRVWDFESVDKGASKLKGRNYFENDGENELDRPPWWCSFSVSINSKEINTITLQHLLTLLVVENSCAIAHLQSSWDCTPTLVRRTLPIVATDSSVM